MERIGVRELRQHASRHLARVKAGEIVEVTERGRPVARLVPIAHDEGWEALVASGEVAHATTSLADLPAPLPAASAPSVGVALVDLRADER